jgi:hypothetical protein
MKWNVEPTLVTMEGEQFDKYEFAELLGIDENDVQLLGDCGSRLTKNQLTYLNNKYPEYMGFFPLLAKAGALIAKGGAAAIKGISGAVKKVRQKRAEKKESSNIAERQKQLIALQQAAAIQRKQAEDDKKKKILMIGVPIAAGILLLLAMNKSPETAKKSEKES